MSDLTVNSTEEFVLRVCQRTCLSLWCCANPRGEPGKELCDILVVCDPHVIIISVKDVRLNTEKELAGFERWQRKAVDASIKQIYGAERHLSDKTGVIFKDGSPGLDLPPPALRKVHRIAVAFGSNGQVPITSGDIENKGFVHAMHEVSFSELLNELDTISDLVDYPAAKEEFAARCNLVVEGSEANLLAFYLAHNRSFPLGYEFLLVDDTMWAGFSQEPEFLRRKEADKESYAWDELIEWLSDPNSKAICGPEPTLTHKELSLRAMARETRFSRRLLGQSFREFLRKAKAREVRSRTLIGPSGVIYVFVYFFGKETPEQRVAELGTRCVAARRKIGAGDVVIGIGIGEHKPGLGSSSDFVYIHQTDWTEMMTDLADIMDKKGYFAGNIRRTAADEYPA